jgi:hypothetical protein
MWSGLNDQLIKMPMALTAEKLGEKFGITRQQCDEVRLLRCRSLACILQKERERERRKRDKQRMRERERESTYYVIRYVYAWCVICYIEAS